MSADQKSHVCPADQADWLTASLRKLGNNAFYMLHEVPEKGEFLREVHGILREGGRFLLVEPMGHVSKAQFAQTVGLAKQAGFVPVAEPRVAFSRAALFSRA